MAAFNMRVRGCVGAYMSSLYGHFEQRERGSSATVVIDINKRAGKIKYGGMSPASLSSSCRGYLSLLDNTVPAAAAPHIFAVGRGTFTSLEQAEGDAHLGSNPSISGVGSDVTLDSFSSSLVSFWPR